jgi:hypothetical protein
MLNQAHVQKKECGQGEYTMKADDNSYQDSCVISFAEVQAYLKIEKKLAVAATFNTYVEKEIEKMWLKSQEHGWSYNDFTSRFLEVLVVLSHRNK